MYIIFYYFQQPALKLQYISFQATVLFWFCLKPDLFLPTLSTKFEDTPASTIPNYYFFGSCAKTFFVHVCFRPSCVSVLRLCMNNRWTHRTGSTGGKLSSRSPWARVLPAGRRRRARVMNHTYSRRPRNSEDGFRNSRGVGSLITTTHLAVPVLRACVSLHSSAVFFLRFDEEERLAVLFIGDDDGWWMMGGGGPNKTRGKKVYAVSCLFFLQPTSPPHCSPHHRRCTQPRPTDSHPYSIRINQKKEQLDLYH
jgi:hypothetical protein